MRACTAWQLVTIVQQPVSSCNNPSHQLDLRCFTSLHTLSLLIQLNLLCFCHCCTLSIVPFSSAQLKRFFRPRMLSPETSTTQDMLKLRAEKEPTIVKGKGYKTLQQGMKMGDKTLTVRRATQQARALHSSTSQTVCS